MKWLILRIRQIVAIKRQHFPEVENDINSRLKHRKTKKNHKKNHLVKIQIFKTFIRACDTRFNYN